MVGINCAGKQDGQPRTVKTHTMFRVLVLLKSLEKEE